VSAPRAMSHEARRAGLEALRAVLRRRHPGFDVVFELEGDDRVHNSATGKIGGALSPPKDSGTTSDGIDVAAAAARGTNHHAVDEPAEHFPALVDAEG
jgi:hypothetical protein